MSEILTERSGSILRITLNRPAKKNAMTSSMYLSMAQILNDAAKDEDILVVLWDGAGDSFSAGNDIEDFLKNPPGPGESPQAQLANALLNFDKPLIAAVKGVAIGGGTTLLTHCDFVFAGKSSPRECVRLRQRKRSQRFLKSVRPISREQRSLQVRGRLSLWSAAPCRRFSIWFRNLLLPKRRRGAALQSPGGIMKRDSQGPI